MVKTKSMSERKIFLLFFEIIIKVVSFFSFVSIQQILAKPNFFSSMYPRHTDKQCIFLLSSPMFYSVMNTRTYFHASLNTHEQNHKAAFFLEEFLLFQDEYIYRTKNIKYVLWLLNLNGG